jgi:arylsulfatase A-like enzyme
VIILTDTVRADHLGAHGWPRPTSPVFDELAHRNFLFTATFAPSSWTRPSVASLFTGLYPQRHGVERRQDALPSDLPTLAARLHDAGLTTIAVTTNPHVTPTWGLTRGFDRVVELLPDPNHLKHGNDAAQVAAAINRLLPTLAPPFFLYVHLIDPHAPYAPPVADLLRLGYAADTDDPRAQYDGELAFADRHVGRILAALDEEGLLEASVVVLTADHGEELYDHGALGHGTTLFEEVIHVPLALRVPPALLRRQRQAALPPAGPAPLVTCPVVRLPVSLVDLTPTLLSLLDQAPLEGIDGRDVSATLTCAEVAPRPLFLSVDKEQSSLAAVVWREHELIVERGTGATALYPLGDRPTGGREAVADPALAAELAQLLATFEHGAQPGLHLVLAGSEGDAQRQRVEVQLKTSGRLRFVRPNGLEPGDQFGQSADCKILWFDGTLASVWHSSPKPIWAQDRDALIFEVEPAHATLEVVARLDGRWATTGWAREPTLGGGRWPVRVDREALLRPKETLPDRRAPGLYLYGHHDAVTTISGDLAAALQALGYLP